MNTRINYLYRDSGNYKTFESRVIAGQMTSEQWETIRSCCIPGDYYFYPEAVGLEPYSGDSWTNSVTDWYELENYELTEETPDVALSVPELVRHFEEAKKTW